MSENKKLTYYSVPECMHMYVSTLVGVGVCVCNHIWYFQCIISRLFTYSTIVTQHCFLPVMSRCDFLMQLFSPSTMSNAAVWDIPKLSCTFG